MCNFFRATCDMARSAMYGLRHATSRSVALRFWRPILNPRLNFVHFTMDNDVKAKDRKVVSVVKHSYF